MQVKSTAMGTNCSKLDVGVIGVGHMGRHHVRIVAQHDRATLVGLYDTEKERALGFARDYGCEAFETLEGLLERVDAVVIAAPTSLHLSIGEQCLGRGIHVMMEKPLADSVDNARRLVQAAADAGVILMVGHVERYNPAIRKMMELLQEDDREVVSIDTRRLMPFDGSRCLDVDVLHDLLIHDVDLVLEIAGSSVSSVSASGRPVFSDRADYVHAMMEFGNGTCATLWAGKCTPRRMRLITVVTTGRCYEADTLSNSLTVHETKELPDMERGICFMGEITTTAVSLPKDEPLRSELEDFFESVRSGRKPLVDGTRGLKDMETLDMISAAVRTCRG